MSEKLTERAPRSKEKNVLQALEQISPVARRGPHAGAGRYFLQDYGPWERAQAVTGEKSEREGAAG